jgi:hypothetical protein
MNSFESPVFPEPDAPDPALNPQEVRCAVRFPLSLPMELSTGEAEFRAFTRDVSANGVLFELDRPLEEGAEIRFSLRMPRAVLGAPHDVLVQCVGRVVRCSMSQSHYLAASTIDQYEIAEK